MTLIEGVAGVLMYALGSISFGRIIAHKKGIDLSKVGSGSGGATNVGRSLGKRAFQATLLLDVCRGILVALIGMMFFNRMISAFLSASLILGNCFPIDAFWKKGRQGGKGIASSLGVLLVIQPLFGIVGLLIWSLVFTKSRVVSSASIVTSLVIIAGELCMVNELLPIRIVMILIGLLVLFRHKDNIHRLLEGSESRFEFHGGEKDE